MQMKAYAGSLVHTKPTHLWDFSGTLSETQQANGQRKCVANGQCSWLAVNATMFRIRRRRDKCAFFRLVKPPLRTTNALPLD